MRALSFSWSVALALTALLGLVNRAPGAPLTFHFEGHITEIHDFLDLDESVFIGAPFSGGYTLDPTGIVDDEPENPRVGSYYFGSAGRMWALIGNYEFTTADLGLLILNDTLGGDLYEPVSFAVSETAGYQWLAMVVFLSDESGLALDSDALFLGVPRLADFPSETSFGIFLPGDDLGIGGTLTSLTPEPASLVLLALGTTGVVCRRRRR